MSKVSGVLLVLLVVSGCVTVSAHEREYLADPTMQPVVDPLEELASRQLHRAREAAGGGDGTAAGGGCGCTN